MDTKKASADLSKAEWEKALQRFRVVRPFLEEEVPLRQIAEECGKSVRTLRYWMARYRRHGLAGLAPQGRSDHGMSQMKPELQAFAKALWLDEPRRPVASIHRQVARAAEIRGWQPPSYDQVLKVVRSLDPSLATLAREGTKVHKQSHELLVRFEASAANEIWQADHKHLGIWICDGKGKPKKPWLTVIEDDYSRAICGYYLGFDAPSSQRTALALRQAIWRKVEPAWPICGIPDTFYTDHGPDFESVRMERVAADIRMKLDYSMVGEPRGRGKIERFFRTIEQMFLCELPGLSDGKEKPGNSRKLLTLPELDSLFGDWLLGVYHRREHGATKEVPTVRWEESVLVPRIPDSLEKLDLLLMTVATTRRIGRDGIRFSNHTYTELTLAPYIGEDVVIRYDPGDMAEIRVYLGGEFLCRAVCAALADGHYTYSEVRQANSRNRRRLRAERRDIETTARELLDLRNHGTTYRSHAELDEANSPASAALPDATKPFNPYEQRPDKRTPERTLKSYRNE